ncbi:MAG TPA: hypothetical protein VFN22_04535 [Gemmatimonadales bacterium]|nr:hypothetical protein [Gemmatimonadales bacterium]
MSLGSVIDQLMARWHESPSPTRTAALADALRKRGDVPESRRVLQDGLGRYPTFIPLVVVRARLALDTGDRAGLEAALRSGMALEPDHPAIRELLEVHWPEELAEEPRERLAFAADQMVEELQPGEVAAGAALVTESLADLYRRQGHLEEARRAYAELVARAPENDSLIARHAAVQEELAASRPIPLDARESGGLPVRSWLRGLATERPATRRPGTASASFDAFFEAPPAPPAATTDFDAFQRWLKELG